MYFLAVIRNGVAFVRGKVSGLHRQTDQPLAHDHEVPHFVSHGGVLYPARVPHSHQ